MLAKKRKMKSTTKYFPGGSKIDIGKSVSVSRIEACYLSSRKSERQLNFVLKDFLCGNETCG